MADVAFGTQNAPLALHGVGQRRAQQTARQTQPVRVRPYRWAMIVRTPDGTVVDQVPIEMIENGDTVWTFLPDGSPTTFVVDAKRFHIDKVAGTATIGLQAAQETDTHGVGLVGTLEAPAGTIVHRIPR